MKIRPHAAITRLVIKDPDRVVDQLRTLPAEAVTLECTVPDVESVRALAVQPGFVTTRRLTLTVSRWTPPRRGWFGRAGGLGELTGQGVQRIDGGIVIDFTLRTPHDLAELCTSALGVLMPHRVDSAGGSALTLARPIVGDAARAWGPPLSRATTGLSAAPRTNIRDADLVVSAPDDVASTQLRTQGRILLTDRRADLMLPDGRLRELAACIDATVHRPIARGWPEEALATLELHDADGALALRATDGTEVVRCERGRWLTARDVTALAPYAAAILNAGVSSSRAVDALLVQLSACGIVVHAPHHAPTIAVHPDLIAQWRAPLDAERDRLERYVASVRQRRYAHLHHSTNSVLRTVNAELSPASPAMEPVSVLLVTMRPQNLGFIAAQLARLDYPNLQFVIGLHTDQPVPASVHRALAALGDRTVLFTAPPTVPFGNVLAMATQRADGDLVTKFDDDDYYAPAHVTDLVLARRHSGAVLVGRPTEFIWLEPLGTTMRRVDQGTERYSAFVAGGTMLMGRGDLESVGGWRPVPRSVDRGLLDRVEQSGGLVYRTHGLGYTYVRGSSGHTWDPGLGYFLRTSGDQWQGLLQHDELGTLPITPVHAPTQVPATPVMSAF